MENYYSPQTATKTFFKSFADPNMRNSPVKQELKAPSSIAKTRIE